MKFIETDRISLIITIVMFWLCIGAGYVFYQDYTHHWFRNSEYFIVDPFAGYIEDIRSVQSLFAVVDDVKKLENGDYELNLTVMEGLYLNDEEKSRAIDPDQEKFYKIVLKQDFYNPLEPSLLVWEYTQEKWVDPISSESILDVISPGDMLGFSMIREYDPEEKTWSESDSVSMYISYASENEIFSAKSS